MTVKILQGDVRAMLQTLPSESVHCCVSSPPYWGLRQYIADGAPEKPFEIGLEPTPDAFVASLVEVFREVKRVLRSDGTLWLNLGDSYASQADGNKNGQGPSGLKRDGRSEGARASANRSMAADMATMAFKKRVPTGFKPKDLIGIPWRVAFALQSDGWWLRSDIIWSKPNPMPESVTDRPTKAHEYVFLLTKSERYFYDAEAIKEAAGDWGVRDRTSAKHNGETFRANGQPPHRGLSDCNQAAAGRNKRSVWQIATAPFSEAHFATFPPELPEICIKAGCPKGGTVLDPFGGAGTTGLVADRLQRNAILIELNPEYAAMAERRVSADRGGLLDVMEAVE